MPRSTRQTSSERLHASAWPDMFANLQTAYAELTRAQFELEQRTTAVEEAHELFQLVIDSMSEALFLVDRAGRVIQTNPAARTLLERTQEEMIGQLFADVWGTSEVPASAWQVLEMSQAGIINQLEVSVQPRTGRTVVLSVSCALVRDSRAKILGMLVVARDITERKRAEQTQAFLSDASNQLARSLQYEETLTAVADLAVPFFADCCIVQILNERASIEHVAVAHADPAKRQQIADRYQRHVPHYALPHPLAQALQTGDVVLQPELTPEKWRAIASNSEHLSLIELVAPRSSISVPLEARGHTLGIMSFTYTESGRQYTADDVVLAADLARRAALAVDNALLFRRAQEATRLREEFLSIASHELKTPLTSVKGSVQLLVRRLRHGDVDPERMMRMTGVLESQIERLETLVSDLLDVSRIQQGRLDLRPEVVDLVDLVQQVLARSAASPERTDEHHLLFDAPEAVIGTWDPARLDQVLTNLISNALKYSPRGGEVRVRVAYVDREAEVTVSDQGIGIAEDDLQALFQPFMRGEATQRGISGTGLGLYITRQIVTQHGGAINVTSAPGMGTTVVVRLPLSMGDDDRASQPAWATSSTAEE